MNHQPITKVQHFLHGADYNPEQWKNNPEIIDEDIRLMKLAGCNVMSLGIFSWVSLEAEEGVYTLEWLDEMIEKLYENGIYVILATPSGARPAWLARKYPEVLRTNEYGRKMKFGGRHNHCLTSPVYRQKVSEMNTLLANRYKDHPGIIMWHVSNEYGGECHCNLCQDAFRIFLKEKYRTLENLNEQYWSAFWSHTYTDWEQIESPSKIGEAEVHGLVIDWRRFVTKQTISFFDNEIAPLRVFTPNIPITTNFMDFFEPLDYHLFAKSLDVASVDVYPMFRNKASDYEVSLQATFTYDLIRGLKSKPFILMESTPSTQNWQDIATLKRPGQHTLSSLLAVAHGSDSVQYFQWRKSRGSSEKFHGAVVDHVGHEHTRVFKEVSKLGTYLKQINEILALDTVSKVAIIFDWENWWAINNYQGYSNLKRNYKETCFMHYKVLRELGVNVDVISVEHALEAYDLVIAPMLYMVKTAFAEKLEDYTRKGGNFVTTYISGIVNENDLVNLGGFPGPLRRLMGIWVEETDVLYPEFYNQFEYRSKTYRCNQYFDVIHLETAFSLADYQKEYYKGSPVVTQNEFGNGKAFYIASQTEGDFLSDFYREQVKNIIAELPVVSFDTGIDVATRENEAQEYLFLNNVLNESKHVALRPDNRYQNILTGEILSGKIEFKAFETRVLKITK